MTAKNEKISPQKTRSGQVVGHKMDKTIVVAVTKRFMHPVFKKVVKRVSKLYAHDSENQAKRGDMVVVAATRPLSKLKRWRLVRIERKAR